MKKNYTSRVISYLAAALLFLLSGPVLAQNLSVPPKREMRAVWVAHVYDLDWPSGKTLTPAQQRQEYLTILNNSRQYGLNAVVVQIRAAGDAVYPTTLAPWSEWLTGTQGKAPDPLYDPLAFMVRETHRRSLEFHAWLNPFRAVVNTATAAPAATHVTKQHPEWVVTYGSLQVLNPGLPAVRQYLTQVVMDVVRRYDVDAIHFDDYFYPTPQAGLTFDDEAAFAADPRGITNKADWRRSNIDLFVKMVSDSIRRAKPWVKFGISPPGVWRNGTSVGGTATNAYQSYADIFADSRKWLRRGWVDYLAPQVYFAIGQKVADFSLIVPWWSQQVNPDTARHVYIGQAPYRLVDTSTEPGFLSPSQLPSQIRLIRQQPNVQGSIQYRMVDLRLNRRGFTDSLRQNFYRYPALIPTMPWKDKVPPTAPVQVSQRTNAGTVELNWMPGATAADGELARQYVIYRLPAGAAPITAADLTDPATIRTITDTTFFQEPVAATPSRYVVTALDRLANESAPTLFQVLTQVRASQQLALLEPAYPNPFSTETQLAFTLPSAGPAELRLLDVTGRTVQVLRSGAHAAGRHEVVLRASGLAAGVYILVLQTAQGATQQRLVLTN